MRKHTKIYLDAFGYDKGDFIACEITGERAVDIHHIQPRGMGGSKELDRVENLMAICRKKHDELGDKTKYKAYLYKTHKRRMQSHGVKFSEDWINRQIEKYE